MPSDFSSDSTTIAIDEPTITRLRDRYGTLVDDVDQHLTRYPWSSGAATDLSQPFPLKLGAAGFAEATALGQSLDAVRQNLLTRIGTVRQDADTIHWGLQFLLEDSDAVEHLNTMTASQFDSYLPTSVPGAASPAGAVGSSAATS